MTWVTITLVGIFLVLSVVLVKWYKPTVGEYGPSGEGMQQSAPSQQGQQEVPVQQGSPEGAQVPVGEPGGSDSNS